MANRKLIGLFLGTIMACAGYAGPFERIQAMAQVTSDAAKVHFDVVAIEPGQNSWIATCKAGKTQWYVFLDAGNLDDEMAILAAFRQGLFDAMLRWKAMHIDGEEE
jgi:hypothetical protein